MEEKLDFSLPQKKTKRPFTGKITIFLLLLLLVIGVLNLTRRLSPPAPSGSATGSQLSPEQTKNLAMKLAQRNLYPRAAKVWQDYLAVADLGDAERARALFQTATLLEKAGQLEEAIEYFYRAENAAKLDELSGQINTHIKDCFEKLGKFSALRYEMMDRTSMEETAQAGAKVVAEIGTEKITEADLDAIIEANIDNQLAPMAAFMTEEQLNEQKAKMLEQYRSSQAKSRFLKTWLTQEILYRQALKENLSDDEHVKKLLNDLARGVLSQEMMSRQLASKIHVTESDIQTYYDANKDKYVAPATARISHILVDDQDKAKDIISRIRGGEDFAELAKTSSLDEGTKENGGKIEADVHAGSFIPTIGQSKELNDKIFAASAGELLDEPVKTEKGWEIVRVDEKTDKRQKTFDEVKQQTMSELLDQKRQDVQSEYIKRMMDKYNVIIHTSTLAPADETEE